MSTVMIAVVATIASAGSAIIAGVSLRLLARQTKILSEQAQLQADQTKALVKQTELQADQTSLMYAATELQFNLDVMVRLEEVLFEIADHEASYQAVWGDRPDNRRPQMASDALLDIAGMALKACRLLPGFASNESGWKSYTKYLMDRSPALRNRVFKNPDWWPEVVPYAARPQSSEAQALDGDRDGGRGARATG